MSGSGSGFLTGPFSGYHAPPTPDENANLTHVERGSKAGELLRRVWQPVCLSEEVGELPKRVRMFGEDLVVFRMRGENGEDGGVGILDLHCPHRGTSLEFGICESDGLRCCYHGWLMGPDGKVLDTPGDPPGSTLKDKLYHAAYAAKEYKGLIFGYFGPPETMPEFPIYDSFEYPGDELVPYRIHYPCNWLQVHENVMDPAHGVFLHTRISFSHFADVWGEIPEMDFVRTPTGMIYVTTRRWNDNIWVRSNDIILPNLAQVGHIWEDGQAERKAFARVGITRWTIPVDNENCMIIGWRHFHPEQDPLGIADRNQCGVGMVDFVGQNGERTYEDRQRIPGDYDAQVSQRPIARHALEHLTYCDKGVVMLRRLLAREIAKVERGEMPTQSTIRNSQGHVPTYCHDTVVQVPVDPSDDEARQAEVGRRITEIIVEGDYHGADDRKAQVEKRIHDYAGSLQAEAAE